MAAGTITRRKGLMTTETYAVTVIAANTNLTSRRVYKGEGYKSQIIVDSGYSIYEIKITMGGLDITSSVYDATYQMIDIPHVTDAVSVEVYAMHTLPSDYIRVDGIKNPSNACLSTDVQGNKYTRIELDVYVDNVDNTHYLAANKQYNYTGAYGTGFEVYNGKLYAFTNREATLLINNPIGRWNLFADNYKNQIGYNQVVKSFSRYNIADNFASIYLFAGNNGGAASASANDIIFSCKIFNYQTASYARYYIPCLNDSGVAGFWDAARGVFQGSSNSTAFEATIEGAVVNPTLPTGYTLLKGAKNPRYAYFDTGYKPNKNTVISVEALLQGTPYLVVSKATGNTSFYGTGFVYDGGVLKAFTNTNVSSTSYTTLGKRVRLKEDNANGKVYVDGRLTNSFTRTNVSDNKNLYVFAYPVGDAPRSANTIIYWIIIKEGDEFKRVYVAARNSSNQVGWYDTVNDTFTVSAAGTGTNAPFVAVEYGT